MGESNPALQADSSSCKDPNTEQGVVTVTIEGGLSIGHQGIIRADKPHDGKLTMRERLIILCKLGAGASSAVYKALDLTDMRLVALKTIQVYEK